MQNELRNEENEFSYISFLFIKENQNELRNEENEVDGVFFKMSIFCQNRL